MSGVLKSPEAPGPNCAAQRFDELEQAFRIAERHRGQGCRHVRAGWEEKGVRQVVPSMRLPRESSLYRASARAAFSGCLVEQARENERRPFGSRKCGTRRDDHENRIFEECGTATCAAPRQCAIRPRSPTGVVLSSVDAVFIPGTRNSTRPEVRQRVAVVAADGLADDVRRRRGAAVRAASRYRPAAVPPPWPCRPSSDGR